MRTTPGPLAAARRWTTGALVAAAVATGVVGVHLAGAATSVSAATSAAGSASDDDAQEAATTAPSGSLFGAVPRVQSGNGRPQATTSGS